MKKKMSISINTKIKKRSLKQTPHTLFFTLKLFT